MGGHSGRHDESEEFGRAQNGAVRVPSSFSADGRGSGPSQSFEDLSGNESDSLRKMCPEGRRTLALSGKTVALTSWEKRKKSPEDRLRRVCCAARCHHRF